jgi:hypothetical protein
MRESGGAACPMGSEFIRRSMATFILEYSKMDSSTVKALSYMEMATIIRVNS